ncbi:MAG: phosphonoacetate hydrolase [Pelagibacteraceae bacterium]|nr:phosphonoacetate hydrolase [Pelagibacteraceae bacterium]PPR50879.1 MAG: Phosphonoacetate hydrolase [Alphaproteobacteria bacterium MarineAlpha5_Bin10]
MIGNININNKNYPTKLKKNVIVICLDGSQKEYFDIALEKNLMPNLKKFIMSGSFQLAHSAIPSFTNPNNISIVTGQPSSIHGICGNFFFDPDSKKEVMMNDPQYLRAPTIFEKLYKEGLKIACVTAKDKLRTLLGNGLNYEDKRAICFSAEKSNESSISNNGISNVNKWLQRGVPDVYSQELSEFVMAAGVKLLKDFEPDIMYLSTTDFIQHKYEPGHPQANKFYEMFDYYLGLLSVNKSSIVVTADHGMKSKSKDDGSPNAIYLQDILDQKFGDNSARVILPITDPYVVHHGALGSYANIYISEVSKIQLIIDTIKNIQGIDVVFNKNDACKKFYLPPDRTGDIVCMSDENMTIGSSLEKHDLSGLNEPLRSHGGLFEREVPFITNFKELRPRIGEQIYNYEAFYYAINNAGEIL